MADINSIRVGQLPTAGISLTDNFPHEVGSDLTKATIEELAIFISNYASTIIGAGFRSISISDGQTLPTTDKSEFILVGAGTYYNVGGGATLVLTEDLNALISNGSFWTVGVEIPVNIEAAIVQSIRSGFTSTSPSENALYDALLLKANLTDLSSKEDKTNKNTANGYAGLGADGKLISSQLPSITVTDTFVVASQVAMLAILGETGDVAVRTDLNKSFILKGTNPTILADWQELLTPTDAVQSFNGRVGTIVPNTGDYTADQITETATRKFQTANQKTFNDATSSIQTQLNGKAPLISHLEFDNTNKTVWNNGNSNVSTNTSFGELALVNVATTGIENTALGYRTLTSLTNGAYNTAVGGWAMVSNTGSYNTAVGDSSLSTGSGTTNTAIGVSALQDITTGNNNVAIGGSAGRDNAVMDNSIFIGQAAKPNASGQTNQIVIGQGAIGAGSNTTTLGNASITSTVLRGAVSGGSFVKSSATATNILLAGGTDIAQSTFAPSTGSTNYIQNRTTQQTADLNISGLGTFGSSVTATSLTAKITDGGFAFIDIESNRTAGQNLGGIRYKTTGNAFPTVELNTVVGQRFYMYIGDGTVAPTEAFSISTSKATTFSSSVTATQYRLLTLNTAPASATAAGTLGEIRVTSTHIYVCTATNVWVRTALTTW